MGANSQLLVTFYFAAYLSLFNATNKISSINSYIIIIITYTSLARYMNVYFYKQHAWACTVLITP
jgi:hypothetical protein